MLSTSVADVRLLNALGLDVVLKDLYVQTKIKSGLQFEFQSGGFVMWSKRFEASNRDLIGLRDRIANAVLYRSRF